MNDLTRLLGNAAHGDAHSLNQLYDQLFEWVGRWSVAPETLDKP